LSGGFHMGTGRAMLAADLSFCLYETKKVQGRFDIYRRSETERSSNEIKRKPGILRITGIT
jgi:hypothetical protein